MEYKDYYKILGVEKAASANDVKHAYRRLARKYHPDVSKEKNAEDKFKEVQEAYEVLKDPEKRKAYDELGSNWKQGQEFRPPPGWQGAHGGFYTGGAGAGGGFSAEDLGGFSEFFANLFGGGRGGREHAGSPFGRGGGFEHFQQRGQDQQAKLTITLPEAYSGISKTLSLQVPEIDTTGQVKHTLKTLKVNIPAGVMSGQKLRLARQGGPGMNGGPPGDLYLEVDVAPHPLFTLKNQDIYLTLPLTPWEAALGAEIRIPTLGGPVGLKIPANSQSGQQLRLKGRGMPSKQHKGDQYVVLQTKIPEASTEEQKQFYQQMSKTMPFNPRQDWRV